MSAPSFRPELRDLAVALGLLTRLPLPAAAFPEYGVRPAAHAAWAYPLVGLLVGGILWAAGALAMMLGVSPAIAAVLAILAGVFSTGAMHEDGLADCADGFWGAWTVERRLEIMKDSQIGTYGVLGLLVCFGLKWSALEALFSAEAALLTLLLAGVASRAAMVVVMYALPNARPQGLSDQTGRPPVVAVCLAGGIGAVAALSLGIWVLLAGFVCAALVGFIAKAKIKGQTGDVLGATQQVVETSTLLAFVAALP